MKKKQDFKLINITNKVKDTIIKYKMISPLDIVIVGVSGGPDSVCLMHILWEFKEELNFDIVVAHFDHGLRPIDDEKETEFVKAMADKIGIPFEYQKIKQNIKCGQGSLEEKARIARYNFLESIRKSYNAHKIALGHTMNDQAETVIMRLLRGSGISGLKGIPPVRDGIIIRPIIMLTRDEVLYYLEKKALSYMIDSSNMDTSLLRNKIRHELIPLLKEEYQPGIVKILSKTSEIMDLEDDFMEYEAKKWIKNNVKFEQDLILLPINKLKELHMALKNRVIRSIIRQKIGHLKRISYDHITNILYLLTNKKPNSEVHLPYNITVKKMYNWILIDTKKEYKNFYYIIPDCGRYYLEEISSWITISKLNSFDKSSSDYINSLLLNADLIEFPIVIRNFRPGDKIFLENLGGHKKLKDLFIDMKIPRDIRRNIPILVNKRIPIYLWYINIMDHTYKPDSNTKNILKISLFPEKKPFWKYLYNKEANYAIG